MIEKFSIRYIIAGVFNTSLGYCLGVLLYHLMYPKIHIGFIGAITHFAAITISFTTYKLYVFRTKGSWAKEYLKSYVVYGSSALLGIVVLWVLIDIVVASIWVAQGASMIATIVLSYLGHSRFTFRRD